MSDTDYESEPFEYDDDDEFDIDDDDFGLQELQTIFKENAERVRIRDDLYDYTNYTLSEVVEKILKGQARQVGRVLGLGEFQVFYALVFNGWDNNNLISDFMSESQKYFTEKGLPTEDRVGKLTTQEPGSSCGICCEDATPEIKNFSLACNHKFCEVCYKTYLNGCLKSAALIKCMDFECAQKFSIKDIDALFSKENDEMKTALSNFKNKKKKKKHYLSKYRDFYPVSFGRFTDTKEPINSDSDSSSDTGGEDNFLELDAFKQLIIEDETAEYHTRGYEYLKAIATAYIESHKRLTWCPAPDCGSAIEFNDVLESQDYLDIHITKLPMVKCSKAHNFCLSCKYENHFPCPCNVVKEWVEKSQDESENAQWLTLNTLPCPKCASSIEKNGGCNHMTCENCRFEFCWICLGPWKAHTNAYNCSKYQPGVAESAENVKHTIRKRNDKYIHYFERYLIHQMSMNKDSAAYEFLRRKVKMLQTVKNVSWIEAQFLKASAKSLLQARNTLKWSYVVSFYLNNPKDNNHCILFEENQTTLSHAVEDLSLLFQIKSPGKIINKKPEFIEKARFCDARRICLITEMEEILSSSKVRLFDLDQ